MFHTLSKNSYNYHPDIRYDEHSLNNLQRILISIYHQHNNQGYRQYYILDNELNLKQVILTNDVDENAKRIHYSTQCLMNALHDYINASWFKDWGSNSNGHVAGVITNLEHTVFFKHGHWIYHPHIHAFLIIYNIYFNYTKRNWLYHNPSFLKLNNYWHECINQETKKCIDEYFNGHNIFMPNDHDLFYITPGYVDNHNYNSVLRVLTNNGYRDGSNLVGDACYYRLNHYQNMLANHDTPQHVHEISYNEAKEFTKFIASEQIYCSYIKAGYDPRYESFCNYLNSIHKDYLINALPTHSNGHDVLPLWYAMILGLYQKNGQPFFIRRQYFGLAKWLLNDVRQGKLNNIPIVRYNPMTKQEYIG